MYMCSSVVGATGNPPIGLISAMSMQEHYNNEADGCRNTFALDAYTAANSSVLAFKGFCGDDDFCANVDIWGKAGMHISLDRKDVVLGKDTTSHKYYVKTAARVCEKQNFDHGKLAVLTWENTAKTKCED